jgi:hypothetical protein
VAIDSIDFYLCTPLFVRRTAVHRPTPPNHRKKPACWFLPINVKADFSPSMKKSHHAERRNC